MSASRLAFSENDGYIISMRRTKQHKESTQPLRIPVVLDSDGLPIIPFGEKLRTQVAIICPVCLNDADAYLVVTQYRGYAMFCPRCRCRTFVPAKDTLSLVCGMDAVRLWQRALKDPAVHESITKLLNAQVARKLND